MCVKIETKIHFNGSKEKSSNSAETSDNFPLKKKKKMSW